MKRGDPSFGVERIEPPPGAHTWPTPFTPRPFFPSTLSLPPHPHSHPTPLSPAGACADEYVVSVTPLGASSRLFSSPPQRTPEFTLTISQLQNGQSYRVEVEVSGWWVEAGGGMGLRQCRVSDMVRFCG